LKAGDSRGRKGARVHRMAGENTTRMEPEYIGWSNNRKNGPRVHRMATDNTTKMEPEYIGWSINTGRME
jgi:hypothetical protein